MKDPRCSEPLQFRNSVGDSYWCSDIGRRQRDGHKCQSNYTTWAMDVHERGMEPYMGVPVTDKPDSLSTTGEIGQ
jgi:hypothetical protein